MSVAPMSFREALGRFASGVCVVTSVGAGGRPIGVTISAFSSLSLDPPLVLFCIGKGSANLESWITAPGFCVNVLGETQAAISEAFAAQSGDKFAGVAGEVGVDGCFRIAGCLVTLGCRRTAVHDEGDHYIVVGRVDEVRGGADAGPLVRFRGTYRTIHEAPVGGQAR